MRPVTEKVLQRLVYERLLLASQVRPSRKKITLEEFLDAAQEEPRIYSALAGILLYKPKIFQNLTRDLKKHPKIATFVKYLFLDHAPKARLFGHDKAFYQKSARTFREYLESEKISKKPRNRILSIRLSEEDLDRLQQLTESMRTRSLGDTVRSLILEKEAELLKT